MRDFLLVLVVFGSLPIILTKPFFGVLVWTWLGLMNPHMSAWSFARGQPFAQLVAIAILGGLFFSRKDARLPPATAITVLLALFWLWMGLTTIFALNLDYSTERFVLVSKIILLTYIAVALLTSKVRVISLVWVMAVSLGLYGVKGGVFTLLGGGADRVMGAAGTFISENNAVGLAMNMTVPLLRFLQLATRNARGKLALSAAIGLTIVAILGTQSRGALVGLVVMGSMLVLKARQKGAIVVMIVALAMPALLFMPESWYQRMDTIDSYEQDASAMGRLNAWWAAWYLALDRPLGAGIGALTTRSIMVAYAPDPTDYHDAHSIYFQVMADHGFFGLGLYLSLGIATLSAIRSIQRQTKDDPRLVWMSDLAAMVYVSLAAFAASGAFLGLAYFDFLFFLVAIVAALQALLQKYQIEGIPDEIPATVTGGGSKKVGSRVPGSKPSLIQKGKAGFKAWFDGM